MLIQGADSDNDEEDSESEEEWGSDSDSSSDSNDDAGNPYAQLKGRSLWLKKNTVGKEKTTKKKEQKKDDAHTKAMAAAAAKAAEDAMAATKSVLPEEGLTISSLNRKVKQLTAQRGRRGKDNRQILRELEALWRLSLRFGPRVEIPICMHVISAQFGLQRTIDDFMDTPTWKACASYLQRIASVLDDGYTLGVDQIDETDLVTNKKMKAAANATEGVVAAMAADEKLVNPHTGEPETEEERAERERIEAEAKMTDAEKKVIHVIGSVALHMTRLEEEYTKSLQKTSHHSPEYIARLRDESKLVELLACFQKYFEKLGNSEEAALLAQLQIEHIYYRHNSIACEVDKAALFFEKFGEINMLHPACVTAEEAIKESDFTMIHPGAVFGKPTVASMSEADFTEIMASLCKYVYKYGTDQAKIRAIICHVYHHALHDRFVDARDLLLMSHLQDTVHNCGDISTMVMFNRMMVNLGMCAFRLGRISDAHQCLSDVCSGRVRELLAQGINLGRFNDKSAEQEKAEKRRQVPYHQHINLDLLEACHLISAMLIEVPNMAGDSSNRRFRFVSRTFRKFYDQYNHQVFTGPPEQTRDFVMLAAKCLMKGDWKTCAELVSGLDVWQLVPGDNSCAEIASMLTEKIKVEGLRTYLFAFSSQYDSLSLSQLCGMFEMSKSEVHSVVSKMMINGELHASWDQPTETVVLRRVEPSALQFSALLFAEKASSLIEANERLLEAQSGSHGHKDDHWKSGDGDERWHNRGNFQRGGPKGNMRSGPNQRSGNNQNNQRGNNQRQNRGNKYQGRRPGGGPKNRTWPYVNKN